MKIISTFTSIARIVLVAMVGDPNFDNHPYATRICVLKNPKLQTPHAVKLSKFPNNSNRTKPLFSHPTVDGQNPA